MSGLSVRFARVTGESEEHVVERRLEDLHVVDEDAGGVEGTDHTGGQPRSAAHGGVKTAAVVARVDGPVDQGGEGGHGSRMRLGEGGFEAGPAGRLLELARRARGDDPTVVDDDDPVGQGVGLVEVLGGEQQGDAVGHQLADHVPHAQPAGGVEPGGRFVEEEDRWSGHQAGGQVEATTHAAGVALHDAVGGVGELEPLEQVAGACLGLRSPDPAQLAHHHQVLAAREGVVEGGVLGGDADVAADLGRLGEDVEAGHCGPTAVGDGQGGEDAHGRRLARPVRTEHAEDGPGGDGEVDAGQGHGLAVAFGQVLRLDHVVVGHATSAGSAATYWPHGKGPLTGRQVV